MGKSLGTDGTSRAPRPAEDTYQTHPHLFISHRETQIRIFREKVSQMHRIVSGNIIFKSVLFCCFFLTVIIYSFF